MAKYYIIKVEDTRADISFHIDSNFKLNIFIVLFLFSSLLLALGIYLMVSPTSMLQDFLHHVFPNTPNTFGSLLGGFLTIFFGAIELYLIISLIGSITGGVAKGKHLRPSPTVITALIGFFIFLGFTIHKCIVVNSELRVVENERVAKCKENPLMYSLSSESQDERWSSFKNGSYEMNVIQCWAMNTYKIYFTKTELSLEMQDDGVMIASLLVDSQNKDKIKFVNGDFAIYLPTEKGWINISRYETTENAPKYQYLNTNPIYLNKGTTIYDAIRKSTDFKLKVPTTVGELEFNFKGLRNEM
ncbi:MAG: hypothetical protein NC548_54515 [Lachnospiraceae bacterium]|nr:hypothetical protein [Lachnospiraceae bacterium]